MNTKSLESNTKSLESNTKSLESNTKSLESNTKSLATQAVAWPSFSKIWLLLRHFGHFSMHWGTRFVWFRRLKYAMCWFLVAEFTYAIFSLSNPCIEGAVWLLHEWYMNRLMHGLVSTCQSCCSHKNMPQCCVHHFQSWMLRRCHLFSFHHQHSHTQMHAHSWS